MSGEDVSALGSVTAFQSYDLGSKGDVSESANLFRILQAMPNLTDLTINQEFSGPQHSVALPPFRLRNYAYHATALTAARWYLPTLKRLSLDMPIALRPSTMLFYVVARVLVPRCVRLRELAVTMGIASTNVRRVVDFLISNSGPPLLRLNISMPPILIDHLSRALAAGFPSSLRALRRLYPLVTKSCTVAPDDIAGLVRICARRKIRFDSERFFQR
ncbi:hypothetical protein AURDEDRAFT_174288 [Auricularia subglabra TFB-10046 SS5]|nr:hypothetical protein AURDEDRAFT_174288 [Auricularia subglabra TFB-10046 SS5]